MEIARRVAKVTPSLTLEITSLAKKLKAEGQAVVNFAAGEPDFDTPQYIKDAAIEALRKGFTKYTPATGLAELKNAIVEKLSRDNRLNYLPEQIVVSCGAKHALYNILQVLCQDQDEVIIASPYWVSYPEMIRLSGAKTRIVKTQVQKGFKLDKASLLAAISRKTKLLILNSPANPTGCVYSKTELAEIVKIAKRNNFYILSDEIYEKIIFDGKRHISCASLNKDAFARTIVVNGVSKAYSMTGWRIGYTACTQKGIIQALSNLQSHSTSNPCSISQKAAYAALQEERPGQMHKMAEEFQAKRDCLLAGLSKISRLSFVKPEGAFYVFCDISRLKLDSLTFSRLLLQEAKVATVPGVAFGRDDYVRLSFATSKEQIQEGVHRLKKWIEADGIYNRRKDSQSTRRKEG